MEKDIQNKEIYPSDKLTVLHHNDWVEKWRMEGFVFPFFKLQNTLTWSTVFNRVCPKCAQRLIKKQKLLIEPDCIAIDADWKANDDIKDKNKIVDYVDFNHKIKQWESVYGQKCSQCGAIANIENKNKLQNR